MNKNLIYIVGATVLVGGGAYLFLKNKKAKDLAKLDELDKVVGATLGGATSVGATISDADLNLANATILASQRPALVAQTKPRPTALIFGGGNTTATTIASQSASISLAKKKLEELDKKLATLGYKVDAIGQLVKI